MTTLAYILAGVGCGIPVLMLGLVVVTLRDNRRRRGTVTITIAPDTTAFVAAIKRAQRDTEKAARQIGGWR